MGIERSKVYKWHYDRKLREKDGKEMALYFDKINVMKEKKAKAKYKAEIDSTLTSRPIINNKRLYKTAGKLTVFRDFLVKKQGLQCLFKGCGSFFKRAKGLKAHMHTHFGTKPFKCTVTGCNKIFMYKPNLETHMTSHEHERPFICKTCLKSYRNEKNLRGHETRHNLSK